MDTTIENQSNDQKQPKKNRFIFRNLKPAQKNTLLAGGSGLMGLMGGAGIFSLFGFKSTDDTGTEAPEIETDTTDTTESTDTLATNQEANLPLVIYTEAPFAEGVTDDMSFNEAFAEARREIGPGGFFEWKGNTYNTYYREEWEALSDGEQEAFMASVHNSTDYESVQDLAEEDTPITTEEELVDDSTDITAEAVDNAVEATPISGSSEAVIVEEEVEPDSYQIDVNQDGIIDAVAIDSDNDDYVDVVAIDSNLDGRPDTYMLDSDNSNTLDSVIIDDMQDGIQGDEMIVPLDEEQVIHMDQLKQSQLGQSNTAGGNDEIPEELPDLDNDMDISDFA